MQDYAIAKKAADDLQGSITQLAVDFIEKDPNRTLLAITATLNAGINLMRASTMPDDVRQNISRMIYQEISQGSGPSL